MERKANKVELRTAAGTKPLLRIEVNLSAAKEMVEHFARDRLSAIDELTRDLRQTIGRGVNEILSAEMSLFLGHPAQSGNKRNGVRVREYYLKGVGCLRLEIPRDRNGSFESIVIPHHERMDVRTKQDLALLHLAGISNRTLAMISERLLGIAVSKTNVCASLGLLQGEASRWLERPLQDTDCWALYVDGTNFKLQRRGSTEREPSLVILGITLANHRTVLGIEPGTRDDVNSWRSAFRELKRRGLNPANIKIGVMDGLPGLETVFREEFPNAVTQRCWVHTMRNAMAKSPARLRDAFKLLATNVMYADGEKAARAAFAQLKLSMATDAQRAVHCIEKDLDSLLAHYAFEKRFWQALKTTNAIERVNKEFKRRTKSMETLGESTLRVVVAFISLRLEMGWRLQPIDARSLDNLALSPNRDRRELNTVDLTVNSLIKKA